MVKFAFPLIPLLACCGVTRAPADVSSGRVESQPQEIDSFVSQNSSRLTQIVAECINEHAPSKQSAVVVSYTVSDDERLVVTVGRDGWSDGELEAKRCIWRRITSMDPPKVRRGGAVQEQYSLSKMRAAGLIGPAVDSPVD